MKWWRNQDELWDGEGWEKHNYIWTESFTSQFQRTNIWALSQKSSEGHLVTLSSHPQWLRSRGRKTHNLPLLWEVYEREQGTHTVVLTREAGSFKRKSLSSSLKERKNRTKQNKIFELAIKKTPRRTQNEAQRFPLAINSVSLHRWPPIAFPLQCFPFPQE